MPVYLIRAGVTDIVKIGWANNPKIRLRSLQTAHWLRLSIIRLIDTTEPAERWMHRHFKQFHVSLEWYRLVPEMLTIEPPRIVPNGDAGMMLLKQTNIPQLAKHLKVTRSAVHQWERVPAERLPEIEAFTGIARHLLRPDICPPPAAQAAA